MSVPRVAKVILFKHKANVQTTSKKLKTDTMGLGCKVKRKSDSAFRRFYKQTASI